MRGVLDVARDRVDYLSESYRVGPTYLGAIRILFALQVLVFPVDYTWASEVPPAFFSPAPGMASVFAGAPPAAFLATLQVLQACLAVALLIGYRTVLVSVSLTVVMMLGSSVVHSFSKIDHFILIEVFPLAMAAAGWGAALSLEARLSRVPASTRGFPMLLWASTVAFALFTAGLPKALSGWLDPARHASRAYLAHDLSNPQKIGPLGELAFSFDQAWFWKATDFATVFVECWLVVAILVPMLFRAGIVMAIGFHIGVYLVLGIDFGHYFLIYAVFFYSPLKRLGESRRVNGALGWTAVSSSGSVPVRP